MKNILAENLLRFGAKNINEDVKKKMHEQTEQTSNQEWRANAVLTDTTNPVGDTKIYPDVFIKDNFKMKPASVLKYSDKSGVFVGMLNNKPSAIFGNLGGQVTGDVEQLVTSQPIDPSGWNEYQWIQLIDKYNTMNSLTPNGISRFFNSLRQVGISTKFGTLTPDRLAVLKLNPDKMNVYIKGIALSGINQNFK